MREEDRGGEAAWVRRGCRRMNLSMKVIGYIALLATQVTAWLMTNKPRYLVWISQWHTISLKLPLLLGNNKPQVCTFTALSSTNKAFGLILVLQKELFGKSRGMNHKVAQISFFWGGGGIMALKDPAPTHNATMLLYLAKGCLLLSLMSDVIISLVSTCKSNLIMHTSRSLQMQMTQP